MAKKKCCKRCKIFFDGGECPICKGTNSSTNWQGRIYVVDVVKSDIAKKIDATVKGEYAIKCR
ncbi:MAG: DNA-directed RNA polymerase subunit E'' [Nanoarchaeota archaeon]|nr:DNA-directed RNA polymerase subunit E'' [Nanoarchaeota archaeon]